MTLERQVDPAPPTVGATAGRIALSCMVGATAVAIAFVARPQPPPPSPPTPAAAPHIAPAITITAPPPIVVNLETVVQSPVAVVAAESSIGCPVLPADEPIGKPATPAGVSASGTVRAASNAPVLAVQAGTEVWVTEDDGRRWSRAFQDHGVERIAVASDGTVYAQADFTVGVRARGGKTAWREIGTPCEGNARCITAIGTLGAELVAFIDDRIFTSTDRARSWKDATSKTTSWSPRSDGYLYEFRGALYQVNHFTDMCGVDDYDTYRLDTKHRVSFDVFRNYFTDTDEPVLVPSTDVDTAWTWADKCLVSGDGPGRCKKKNPARRQMMEAAMLAPREGARAFAIYNKSLIELCSSGVRQVYREFPFDHLDAVDASGRALVMDGEDLFRWSPSSGWRKLRGFVNQQARGEASED